MKTPQYVEAAIIVASTFVECRNKHHLGLTPASFVEVLQDIIVEQYEAKKDEARTLLYIHDLLASKFAKDLPNSGSRMEEQWSYTLAIASLLIAVAIRYKLQPRNLEGLR